MVKMTPNVAVIRKAMEMTQEELAAAIGAHRVTVAHWEAGLTFPSVMAVKALRRLAKKRGVEFVEVVRRGRVSG